MEYNNLSKKELVTLLEKVKRLLEEGSLSEQELVINNASDRRNALENLIGTIPFLLLNQKFFEKNQDIADFAGSLGIHIPSPEKKKREDMIGRIVSAIARFDSNRIIELNVAIRLLKKSESNKEKSNFFKDWEDAIKRMKL